MPNKQGFTLIELLIALAVIGILATLGFSSLINAQRNAQLNEATAQFATDLQRARSEAQRYNRNASLTLSGDSSYILTLNGNATTRTLPHGAQVEVGEDVGGVARGEGGDEAVGGAARRLAAVGVLHRRLRLRGARVVRRRRKRGRDEDGQRRRP